MKHLLLLIILLTLKLSSFSQTTSTVNNTGVTPVTTEATKNEYPILLKSNGQTLVCFTMVQARQMAKEIKDCEINSEIIAKYELDQLTTTKTIAEQKTLIETRNQEIALYKSKEIDFKNKIDNKGEEIANLNIMNKNLSNKVIKYKIATFGGFSLAVALPVVLMILNKK